MRQCVIVVQRECCVALLDSSPRSHAMPLH
jgi:hypothetical protein